MPELHKMTLDYHQHRGKFLWFDEMGMVYYGPDGNNLICPEGLSAMGKFPVSLVDVKAAFALGVLVGRGQTEG